MWMILFGSALIVAGLAMGWHIVTSAWKIIKRPGEGAVGRIMTSTILIISLTIPTGFVSLGAYGINFELTVQPKYEYLNRHGMPMQVTKIENYVTTINGRPNPSLWLVTFRAVEPLGVVDNGFTADATNMVPIKVGDTAVLYERFRGYKSKKHPRRLVWQGKVLNFDWVYHSSVRANK